MASRLSGARWPSSVAEPLIRVDAVIRWIATNSDVRGGSVPPDGQLLVGRDTTKMITTGLAGIPPADLATWISQVLGLGIALLRSAAARATRSVEGRAHQATCALASDARARHAARRPP